MLEDAIRAWAQDWKEEGLAEGRKQGGVEMLLRQLERRFGPLDEVTRRRVEAAEPDQLLAWGDRLVTASRLAEVFAS